MDSASYRATLPAPKLALKEARGAEAVITLPAPKLALKEARQVEAS